MQPPVAKTVPHERVHHGDRVDDPYFWLADKENKEVVEYLEAENAYTEARTAGQADLRERIFQEIKGRTKETDLSVPSRKGGWWYYSRTQEGKQYGIHCRVAADGDMPPVLPEDGSALPGEQVLLDGNELAEGHGFFSLGTFDVSPDGKRLAYSVDFAGNERFTLKFKELDSGEVLPDEIPETSYGTAWSLDGSTLFYLTVDDAWRPYRVHRHTVGTSAADDVLVLEEPDERFWVGVGLTRSERYIEIGVGSKTTSEVRLLDAAQPGGEFTVVAPRRQGVEYSVDHWVHPTDPGRDLLLILHNSDGRENFELATASLAGPGDWTPLIEHRADTRLVSADAFAEHMVLEYRRDGLTGLSIHPMRDDLPAVEGGPIAFDEPIYTVGAGDNPEFRTGKLRLGYTSMVTPSTVYDYDIATGTLILLKRQPVLGGFDPADYEQHRSWATADDGTRVPISIVHRKGVEADGTAPAVIYGYGSYESSTDPYFSVARLSLLDRGFVFAVAHIRGGGEMGRRWYEEGKLLAKRNTFTDFVACARQLVRERWTSADRLIARGGSAGGLLMGAVANLAPEAFRGVVADVPFVDALNTILDPSLPLTVMEWEEWGNPLESAEVYAYMKGYSPYENVEQKQYPAILATTSLNDTRVYYHEPAKWIARLRATATGGDFLLKTEMEAGHGGRSGRYDAWREEALTLAWVITTATGGATATGEAVSGGAATTATSGALGGGAATAMGDAIAGGAAMAAGEASGGGAPPATGGALSAGAATATGGATQPTGESEA
ncbi:MAG TPA: S9 family peptidase [Actinocrinis sp.]|jgi:oligopeptidase B|uniref:S9 family peptidase n=1 Tax=Actinocrinis sp. TaxID=1920516 RepID=UPI002DDD4602|nr:S9 family peptidase [Actinocrinis sp.]HEV3173522.1 S9 family peptidase [Actinocrinis sp.]